MSADGGSLVLLRHGESTANAAGSFTGLLDVPLTDHGRRESLRAGALLRAVDFVPDAVLSSPLVRATETAAIVAAELGWTGTIEVDARLAERNYGAFTGRSKHELLAEIGPHEFHAARRSLHRAPPPMGDELFAALAASGLATTRTESLADVVDRVGSLWSSCVRPLLLEGRDVLVVAHGNSLRALVAVIDALDAVSIEALNLPTGQPLLYRFAADGTPLERGGEYLDAEAAAAGIARVAAEGGT
jgi:2,3-bisphosphoglycerate-dependent phosphoglycerate mutase